MSHSADDTQFEGTREAAAPTALDPDRPVFVHIIPQAHIDLAWQWAAADGVEMVLETFRAHAELLEADNSRTYCQSQLAAYAIVEREDPDLFKRIQALVAEERWEIVGGEWVEPDRGIPGGESLVRQLLEGQLYAQDRFGVRAEVAWCPDSFTYHPGNLPQLLVQAGLRFQMLKRPREKYVSLPLIPFTWRGTDGTGIVTYRSNNKGSGLPGLSEGTPDPPHGTSHLAVYATAFQEVGLRDLWGPLGVGDTGGVNTYDEPASGPGWSSGYSTPTRYVRAIDGFDGSGCMPEVAGGIGPMMAGCLTTHAEMKSLNRRAESLLQSAEVALSVAGLLGGDDVAPVRIQEAWRRVLFNQFHDVVTGVGIPETHVEAAHSYRVAIDVASENRRVALRSLARRASRKGDLSTLVFNDLGWTRSDAAQLEIDLGDDAPAHWEAVAPDGSCTPVVLHGVRYAQRWRRHSISFVAPDVPGMGYRAFELRPCEAPRAQVRIDGTEMQSDRLRLRVNASDGSVSIGDTRTGVEFDGRLSLPRLHEEGEYFLDYGVEHRAWYLGLTGREKPVEFVGMRVVEDHASLAAIETVHRFGASELVQRYVLRPGTPFVEVVATVDWHEIEHLLRLHFETDLDDSARFALDSPWSVLEREADGVEMPMQMFCDLSNDGRGLGLLNDGRYGAAANGDEITLSATRCSTLPDPRSDEGVYSFRYGLVPHVGGWRESDLARRGHAFNRPLIAVPAEGCGDGSLPEQGSVVSAPDPAVLPVVLKPAADGSGWALRAYTTASLQSGWRLAVSDAVGSMARTNILEDDLGNDGAASGAPARPFEVATWRLSRRR